MTCSRKYLASESRRRGAVLLIAIVLLVIASAMSVGILSSVARRHRELRRHEQELQARWLAESALERSAAKLRDDSSYTGETWRIPADDIARANGAAVAIYVEMVSGLPARRAVRVVADLPETEPDRIRYSKQVLIDLPSPGKLQ